MHCWLVAIVVVQCLCDMPLFLLRFLAWTIAGHILKTMTSISYTCKCTHRVRDVGREFVMVAGVSRGTNVL